MYIGFFSHKTLCCHRYFNNHRPMNEKKYLKLLIFFFNSFKVSEIETILQFVSRKYETERISW